MRLVVMQPTSRCNLNCSYCYVPGRRDKRVMSRDTLTAAMGAVLGSRYVAGHSVEFLWHAGEPLVVPPEFYEAAFATAEDLRGDLTVHHAFQTNAVLVNERWCRLFEDHGISVGVSVDGPAFLHDSRRQTWTGRGTHDLTMRGICQLRAAGIGVGALCVLTEDHLDHPDAVFDFFEQEGFSSIGFNVEEVDNANTRSSLLGSDHALPENTVRRFRVFFERFFDRWAQSGFRMVVREFNDFLGVADAKLRDDAFVRQPDETRELGIITIHRDGRVSPYSPEFAGASSAAFADFIIGDVATCSIDEMLDHPTYRLMRRAIETKRSRCSEECHMFSLCGSDYASNGFFETGDLSTPQSSACTLLRLELYDVLATKFAEVQFQQSPARRTELESVTTMRPT